MSLEQQIQVLEQGVKELSIVRWSNMFSDMLCSWLRSKGHNPADFREAFRTWRQQ